MSQEALKIPPLKKEATKVNTIMEQLKELDGNGHRSKTNINHFVQLLESDDAEINKYSTKPKTPIIVRSEDAKGSKIKEIKSRVMKNINMTGKRR